MSKLVTKEIFDVVEKLHKAGLSDAVAIEVIRQNRDYNISKLATAEQVQNVEEKVNSLEEKVNSLEEKVDDLKDDFSDLRNDFKNLEGKVNLLELEVSHIKDNMVTKVEFTEFKREVDVKFTEFKREVDVKFGEFKVELESKLGSLKSEIKETGSSLMKWFIVLFTTQIASVVGVIVTLLLK